MKKFLIPVLLVALTACGSNDSGSSATTDKKDTTTVAENDLSSNPDYKKGLKLVNANGCLTCHHIDDKLTGPAYREVANKYAGASDTIVAHLAKKIIAGGSGVWGTVPMIAHPQLSEEDAEAMVKYILLLKK